MRGRFIALEGGEGVGKSTQAAALAERLRARGLSVVLTREPGGTPGAEAIRDLLLHRTPPDGWTGEAEALLFAAARADHVARRIRPALDAGDWVVCDRFVGSSIAYQGGAGDLTAEAIRDLHRFGSGGLTPDATLVLALTEGEGVRRATIRDNDAPDAIGGRSDAYHRAVEGAFRALAEEAGAHRIDADGSPDEVAARIDRALAGLLP